MPSLDPPIDMLSVVAPFIKSNKEFFTSVPADGDFYKLVGTKTESNFYFCITPKKTISSTGIHYWVIYSPGGRHTSDPVRKVANMPLINRLLDYWLSLIKQHRAHYEDVPLPEPVAAIPNPVIVPLDDLAPEHLPGRTPSRKPSIKKQAMAKIRAVINKIKYVLLLSEIKNIWINKFIDMVFLIIGTALLALVGFGVYKLTGYRPPWF
jgi:hypothetical protein